MGIRSVVLAVVLVAQFVTHAVVLAPRIANAAPCGATGTPTTTVYLPNITKTLGGPAGWQTPFIVQNVGTAATTLEVSFYRFSDGSLVTCQSVPGLLQQRSFAHVPNNDADLPGDSQFSVVVRSFGSPVEAVVNQHQGAGARAEALSYVGLTSGTTRIGLPWVAKGLGGWLTTFVVQNLGTAVATVTIALANEDGTRNATLTRSIAPGRSAVVDPSVEPALVAGTSYAALLTSEQPIGAIANAHNDAPTVAQPMAFSFNGIPATAGAIYVPWVGRNVDGSLYSTIVVQNIGTFDASPTLTFHRIGGTEQVVRGLGISLKPGRATQYALPAPSTSCPTGGSASCPREGEHSIVVTGGSFAVLAYALGPTSAMAIVGAAAAPSRVYLPNVTRTLGGPTGWTTPIVIQSTGATSAMLRWYRFTDGSLAATQYVPGLSAGASVRIDPRNVTGLADGTQYAVVADAAGPLRAIVLELSTAGGDGAMAYEGFAATGVLSAAPTLTSIAVTPATAGLGFGGTQQMTATVKDQFGNTVAGVPLTWTVEPSTIGTMSATGLLTARQAQGTATIRATFGPLSATAIVSIVPKTVTIGSLTFNVVATTHADVYAERSITTADSQSIVSVVDPSVNYIESWFGRKFAQRPQIYVFPDHATYLAGYGPVLGAVGSPREVNGIYVDASKKIGLNWRNIRVTRPYGTVRHELVHQMELQITKRTKGQVPTWFAEGLAQMHDLTEPGGGHDVMESRYRAASMAATGTLFATRLTDDEFRALGDIDSNIAYMESGETVRIMTNELSQVGLIRVLEEIGRGQTLASAYAAVSGRDFAVFMTRRDVQLRALAVSYPGVLTATSTFEGEGLTYMVYGVPPGSTITVTITGGSYLPSVNSRTVDRFGVFISYLDRRWVPATYTFTVQAGTTTVSTSAVKPSGLDRLTLVYDYPAEMPLTGSIPIAHPR